MKRSLLLSIPTILFLTACATSYHSQGFLGDGYSEIITNPDSFIVTFKGNEFTSQETALRFALLRASELTLANGYKYFVVLSSKDQSSSYHYSNTYSDVCETSRTSRSSKQAKTHVAGAGSTTTYSGVTVKPGTSIRIKCFMEKPQTDEMIDAQFYWNANAKDL